MRPVPLDRRVAEAPYQFKFVVFATEAALDKEKDIRNFTGTFLTFLIRSLIKQLQTMNWNAAEIFNIQPKAGNSNSTHKKSMENQVAQGLEHFKETKHKSGSQEPQQDHISETSSCDADCDENIDIDARADAFRQLCERGSHVNAYN